ncbi:hypothetical protein LUZ61_011661 [Rhynchospora tenuis]|uniref:Reverse transcriptase zinc-binding domain-containing protein n=1 Tax=Rhynchospora tenuis TaxID=198213 RepID=A0AAD6A1F2_9POAL|nr:hypothetical protein LUZ61_011661 [Rhynchospora tenuis]
MKAKNGKYTIKQGYEQLQGGTITEQLAVSSVQWVNMWKWKDVIPKVKVFVWRLLSKALPVAQNMHRRITAISPRCHRCGMENEFEMHCMFFCPSSRVVWFGGRLGLTTHDLPINIDAAFSAITEGLDEEGRRYVCYTLWEIWLAHNQEFFHHKKVDPIAIWRKVNDHMNCQHMKDDVGPHVTSLVQGSMAIRMEIQEWMVLMDASCDDHGRAGMAFLIYRNGELMGIGMNNKSGVDAFWGEALVLLEAVQFVQEKFQVDPKPMVTLLTDCLNLVDAVTEQDFDSLPSWKARDTVALVICEMRRYGGSMEVKHVKRDIVKEAHTLANHARRESLCYKGLSCPQLMNLTPEARFLDSTVFSQLQDRPL